MPCFFFALLSAFLNLVVCNQALDEDSKALTRHQTKQAETEREVKSFETRRQLEYEQTIIGLLVNYAEYYVARDVWNTAKSKRAELTSEVAELEAANAPFMQSKASVISHELPRSRALADSSC